MWDQLIYSWGALLDWQFGLLAKDYNKQIELKLNMGNLGKY